MATKSSDFAGELSQALSQVAQRAGPALVSLGGSWRGGNGLVVAQGFVLTNAHNVHGEEQELVFADGRRERATLAGLDVDGDLAVLAAETGEASALEWTNELPQLGSLVVAMAAGSSGPRVTLGTISNVAGNFRGPRGRPIAGGLEHTAPLAPGSSGSALLDLSGRLVGINTNRLGGGFYVALPADEPFRRRVAAMQQGERVERPRLGIGLAPPHASRRLRRAVGLPERDGLLVREVEGGSPAERAGIGQGDLITEAAGRMLADADDLYAVLGSLEAGSGLALTVVRGTEERTVEVDFSA